MVKPTDDGKKFELSLLRALWTLKFSWDEVTAATIANCFKHASFPYLPRDKEDENLEETFDEIGQTLEKD